MSDGAKESGEAFDLIDKRLADLRKANEVFQ
jgi:hypothetical protein